MADDPKLKDAQPAPETPVDAGSQALSEAPGSSFGIVKVVMVVLVVVFLCSGIFVVGPQEQAIKLRLGKPIGQVLDPGLHFSFPYPIEEYKKVSVKGIKKVVSTVGWYATTPEQELAGVEPMAGSTLNPLVDGYVLTADRNIIHTRATLTYHVEDPVRYIFSFVNTSNSVQTALDNALLLTASHFRVDDILTRDVAAFKEAVRSRAIKLVAQYELGVAVEDCVVESRPPRQLKMAFDSVLKAEVTRNSVLNDARSYENQVTNRAGADAQSHINAAESERVRLVNDVRSQAERFNELLPRYEANRSLFVQKALAETLGRVMTNVQDKVFLTESSDGRPKELRLLLNREAPKKAETPAP